MESVIIILAIVSEIYKLCDSVKSNKETCQIVLRWVKSLVLLVESIKKRDTVCVSEDVERILKELIDILKAAQELIKKCTKGNTMERIARYLIRKKDLNIQIERIKDGFQQLAVAMQLEQSSGIYEVYKEVSRKEDDEEARTKDDKALKDLIQMTRREQPEELEEIEVEKLIEKLSRPQDNCDGIRMIKLDELEYGKKPFMKTPTTEVYKGTYRKFQVVIKRYMEPVNHSPSQIRAFFEREVITMKQCESPNILRMYGICVRDRDGPNPQLLIVTEFCERGSLRQVLDSNTELSWAKKARMCLDAAQGLYRLHNTEVRSRVHGCITSSKFLVAKDFTVKLGGFELAKTETSLRSSKIGESRSSCYESPQKLINSTIKINYEYTKECEIYSFGIVLWEIATRKIPFENMSVEEIQKKVCDKEWKESIPDCPKPLEQVINECRAFDPFHRPSAGALVDKLQIVVAQLEEQ